MAAPRLPLWPPSALARPHFAVIQGVILRSGPANSETAEMGVLTYLGWLVLAGVETRWNVMGGCPPSRMQKLYLASCGRHDELGM